MYFTWHTNEDPKFNAVRHILEPDAPKDDPGHVELDDGNHRRSQKPDRVEEQPRTPTARPWEFNSVVERTPALTMHQHPHQIQDDGTLRDSAKKAV